MTYGCLSYGSTAIGGEISAVITCNPPSANLIVMNRLLEIGYTYEEALRLMNLIDF